MAADGADISLPGRVASNEPTGNTPTPDVMPSLPGAPSDTEKASPPAEFTPVEPLRSRPSMQVAPVTVTSPRRSMVRSTSNPAIQVFGAQDGEMSPHVKHDRHTQGVLRRMATGKVDSADDDFGDLMVDIQAMFNHQPNGGGNGKIDGFLRSIGRMEEQRAASKRPQHVSKEKAKASKEGEGSEHGHGHGGHEKVRRDYLTTSDKLQASVVFGLSVLVVIILCIWSKNGLHGHDSIEHIVEANSRPGHIKASMHTTPTAIMLPGTESQYFEVRIFAAATHDFAQFGGRLGEHRRLWEQMKQPRQLAGSDSVEMGSLTYKLFADGKEFYTRTFSLLSDEEVEDFQEVDVGDLGYADASRYTAEVTASRPDGKEVSFLLQVVRMSSAGRYRKIIGIIIFVITFISIVSEKIHRSYSAFLGATTTLCVLTAVQETPHLIDIVGMVDWGTLMLLFSMMILMRMLAVTGFFNWFALKVVAASKQDARRLFFLLTNICGVLSMVLDNVTCVLLFGPLTFSIAKRMRLNPRPIYLAMTICATVGGTATLIGDPPNIVIGSKMKIGFEKFVIFNLPIVVIILPLSSVMLYMRCKNVMYLDDKPQKPLDLKALEKDHRIEDVPMFTNLAMVLFAVLLALLLSPLHHIHPEWWTVMAMFGCAMMFERHALGKYLEFVEWDTLLFFALLFVLVESLSELGVIRMLVTGIVNFIQVFPEGSRMSVALIVILWVSALGSAFLESLPYTATMVYILLDMQKSTIPGIDHPEVLVWPLSVGACVGGIGSIMGSSANLVCIAVSNRYCTNEEHKVHGGDFLRYGLPTMLVLVALAMVWQLIIFAGLEVRP